MLKLFVLSVLLGLNMSAQPIVIAQASPAAVCETSLPRCGGHALTDEQRAWFRRAIDHILEGRRSNGADREDARAQRPDVP